MDSNPLTPRHVTRKAPTLAAVRYALAMDSLAAELALRPIPRDTRPASAFLPMPESLVRDFARGGL